MVADEVPVETVLDAATGMGQVVDRLLRPALRAPRQFGRFATAFAGLETRVNDRLWAAAAAWLERQATTVALSLLDGVP